MPDPVFDLSFRPLSYWLASDRASVALATVRGEQARFRAAALASGMDPGAYVASLPPGEGPCVGSSPASLLAGAFLPPARGSQVEIARISYASMLGDVVSIRARWSRGRIRYSIVDDFVEDRKDLPYEFRPKSSSIPLTMGQLVRIIDEVVDPWADGRAGLVLGFVQEQVELGLDPDELVDFVRVTSVHYPGLGAWYRAELAKWLARIEDEQAAEAREERRREVLARREALRRLRAEDRLVAASAPKAPWEIPEDLTIQDVGRVDLGLLQKWLRTIPEFGEATITVGCQRYGRSMRGMSKTRYLHFDWTAGGVPQWLEVNPGTVRGAFDLLAARSESLRAALARTEAPLGDEPVRPGLKR